MADFTDRDKDILDRLFKAYEKTSHTDASRDPWHELYGRDTTVNAQRATMAADVLQGWMGSWASAYDYGFGSVIAASGAAPTDIQSNDSDAAPVPIRAKTTKLGLRGPPDIDFVPYNWRTNRFGGKGPALVGHPISYEVQGPTMKSQFCDWTWEVRGGAGPNGGDLLIMSTRPDGTAATTINVSGGYNIPDFTIGAPAEPNGGLYLLVTDDGTDDGAIPAGTTPMTPLPPAIDTARYELFRISDVTTNPGSGIGEVEVHPSKPLSRIFSLPTYVAPGDERFIRAITFIQPYVARLAAVQGSGVVNTLNTNGNGQGRERTFLVVSPERSASGDEYPPFDGGGGAGTGGGTWIEGGFTESGAPGSEGAAPPFPAGTAGNYMGRVPLPIPLPIRETVGSVEFSAAVAPTTPVGNWLYIDPSATGADVGRIIRINQAERPDVLPAPGLAYGKTTSTVHGWWPIDSLNGAPVGFVLSRVPEIDPESGRVYFGPGPYVQDAGVTISVAGTVHNPVSTLFTGSFKPDQVEAARVKNLIDPRYVARDPKRIGAIAPSAVQPYGSSSGRSDQAVWPTETFASGGPILDVADPGNLLDLGFRMILFPARDDGLGNAIPDFNKPITSREIIIDSAIDEKQYIDIDYSGGVVRLSHPPPDRVDPLSAIVPNGWPGSGVSGSNNERGEAVLFAACIPYSMEENQVGTGNRVTAQNAIGRDIDVFSTQINANIDLTNTDLTTGVPPFVGPSGIAPFPVEIVLDRLWDGPDTGVITMTSGGLQGRSFGNWAFTETRTVAVGPNLVTALGGISLSPAPGPVDPIPGAGEVRSVVLRREVNFGLQSPGLNLTDDYELDTTYGSSARARVLRFDNADLTYELDGSLLVKSPGSDTLDQQWHQWGHLSAGGQLASVGPIAYDLTQSGILAGLFWEDQTGGIGGPLGTRGPDPEGQFQFFDGVTGEIRGFFTQISTIEENHVFRMVNLIQFNGGATGPGDTSSMFCGLSTGGTIAGFPPPVAVEPRVAEALAAVPPVGNDYIGLKWRGVWTDPATVSLDFFVQNGTTGLSTTVPTGILLGGPIGAPIPIYFAVETSRSQPILKLAIYDIDLVKLGELEINDPTIAPGLTSPLEYLFGLEVVAAGGRPAFEFGYVNIQNRVDLQAPKI